MNLGEREPRAGCHKGIKTFSFWRDTTCKYEIPQRCQSEAQDSDTCTASCVTDLGESPAAFHTTSAVNKDVVVTMLKGPALLHNSASNGQIEEIRALVNSTPIKQESDVLMRQDSNGDTALSLAAEHGYMEIVRYILCIVNSDVRYKMLKLQNEHGQTALINAASNGHSEVVMEILKFILSQNGFHLLLIQNNDGETAISVAAYYGYSTTVELILNFLTAEEKYTSLCIQNRYGDTALSLSVSGGHTSLVRLILCSLPVTLEFRYELLRVQNSNHATALLLAASQGNSAIVRTILCSVTQKHKYDLLMQQDGVGNTPLFLAVIYGHTETVHVITCENDKRCEKVLKESNIDFKNTLPKEESLQFKQKLIAQQNSDGETAISLAVRHRRTDVARTVWDCVDSSMKYHLLTLQNKDGDTTVISAIRYGLPETFRSLLNVSNIYPILMTFDRRWRTALHHAASKGYTDVPKYIQNATTPDQWYELLTREDIDGDIALSLAANYGHTDATSAILGSVDQPFRETMLEFSNSCGQSPLHYAAMHGFTETVDAMLSSVERTRRGNLLLLADNEGSTPISEAAMNGHVSTLQLMICSVEPDQRLKLIADVASIGNGNGNGDDDLSIMLRGMNHVTFEERSQISTSQSDHVSFPDSDSSLWSKATVCDTAVGDDSNIYYSDSFLWSIEQVERAYSIAGSDGEVMEELLEAEGHSRPVSTRGKINVLKADFSDSLADIPMPFDDFVEQSKIKLNNLSESGITPQARHSFLPNIPIEEDELQFQPWSYNIREQIDENELRKYLPPSDENLKQPSHEIEKSAGKLDANHGSQRQNIIVKLGTKDGLYDSGYAASTASEDCEAHEVSISDEEEKEDTVVERGGAVVEKGDTVVERGGAVVEKGVAVVKKEDTVVEKGDAVVERGDAVVEKEDTVVEEREGEHRMIGETTRVGAESQSTPFMKPQLLTYNRGEDSAQTQEMLAGPSAIISKVEEACTHRENCINYKYEIPALSGTPAACGYEKGSDEISQRSPPTQVAAACPSDTNDVNESSDSDLSVDGPCPRNVAPSLQHSSRNLVDRSVNTSPSLDIIRHAAVTPLYKPNHERSTGSAKGCREDSTFIPDHDGSTSEDSTAQGRGGENTVCLDGNEISNTLVPSARNTQPPHSISLSEEPAKPAADQRDQCSLLKKYANSPDSNKSRTEQDQSLPSEQKPADLPQQADSESFSRGPSKCPAEGADGLETGSDATEVKKTCQLKPAVPVTEQIDMSEQQGAATSIAHLPDSLSTASVTKPMPLAVIPDDELQCLATKDDAGPTEEMSDSSADSDTNVVSILAKVLEDNNVEERRIIYTGEEGKLEITVHSLEKEVKEELIETAERYQHKLVFKKFHHKLSDPFRISNWIEFYTPDSTQPPPPPPPGSYVLANDDEGGTNISRIHGIIRGMDKRLLRDAEAYYLITTCHSLLSVEQQKTIYYNQDQTTLKLSSEEPMEVLYTGETPKPVIGSWETNKTKLHNGDHCSKINLFAFDNFRQNNHFLNVAGVGRLSIPGSPRGLYRYFSASKINDTKCGVQDIVFLQIDKSKIVDGKLTLDVLDSGHSTDQVELPEGQNVPIAQLTMDEIKQCMKRRKKISILGRKGTLIMREGDITPKGLKLGPHLEFCLNVGESEMRHGECGSFLYDDEKQVLGMFVGRLPESNIYLATILNRNLREAEASPLLYLDDLQLLTEYPPKSSPLSNTPRSVDSGWVSGPAAGSNSAATPENG